MLEITENALLNKVARLVVETRERQDRTGWNRHGKIKTVVLQMQPSGSKGSTMGDKWMHRIQILVGEKHFF